LVASSQYPLEHDTRVSGPAAPPGSADRARRLENHGPGGLTDAELLELVLAGPGGGDARNIAEILLGRFGCLGALVGVSAPILAASPGLGEEGGLRIVAALELGMRALEPVPRSGILVRGPADLHQMLVQTFRGLDRERFLALYLDTRHRVQTVETVSIGSLNASLVHPREVFKTAVSVSAAAVIVAHNHPSGSPSPSRDDLELTARLAGCGELLGIALLDHLVCGDGEVVSIREYGWPEPLPGHR
jgi:DNA repair protein RadC